jgi:hypothetical protein
MNMYCQIDKLIDDLQWVYHNISNSTDYDWHNSNWRKMFTELIFILKTDHVYENGYKG